MISTESEGCALCGRAALAAPRLFVRQQRALDLDRTHQIALCVEHAGALCAGVLDPQQIIFDWTKRFHDHLYENTRLVLRPELRCLACNAPLPANGSRGDKALGCRSCSAWNVIGSALGYPVAVRLGSA